MIVVEKATHFLCQGQTLYGILSLPRQQSSRGIMIVVGGPQYRVGSHRQFTLLARDLAASGVPTFRFDYRGMGDSEGEIHNFEEVEDDLRQAINHFFEAAPSLKEVVIWGLCDGASAALFYAHQDPRVTGLVLLNPWVRTEETLAKAYLKHYYLSRLVDPELWVKIRSGHFDFRKTAISLLNLARTAIGPSLEKAQGGKTSTTDQAHFTQPLPDRMYEGFKHFKGKVLLIVSGKDLTAHEFLDLAAKSRKWRTLLGSSQVKRHDLLEANHTFSTREWRSQVSFWTKNWVSSW